MQDRGKDEDGTVQLEPAEIQRWRIKFLRPPISGDLRPSDEPRELTFLDEAMFSHDLLDSPPAVADAGKCAIMAWR
jgi:hypothetical protein